MLRTALFVGVGFLGARYVASLYGARANEDNLHEDPEGAQANVATIATLGGIAGGVAGYFIARRSK